MLFLRRFLEGGESIALDGETADKRWRPVLPNRQVRNDFFKKERRFNTDFIIR